MKFKAYLATPGRFFAAIAILLATTFAFAYGDPKEMLESTTKNVLSEIKKNEAQLKADRKLLYSFVEKEVIPHVDVEYTSKLVLGRNWNKANETQRAEFQKEFTSFLVKNYASGMFGYDGQDISFGPPKYNDDKTKAIVKATMASENGPIEGDIKLVNRGGEWKLYNAEVEDVNLVSSFRTTYNDIISKRGIDGLISDLKAKNAEYN